MLLVSILVGVTCVWSFDIVYAFNLSPNKTYIVNF